MRGLALLLLHDGYQVSGSDRSEVDCFKKLRKLGATCYPQQIKGQGIDADLVVITSAIPADNPELMDIKAHHIPVMERAQLLGQLLEQSKLSVGVSGMHGKTTCSSMLVTILELCGLDPTANLGGELDIIGGATKAGSQDLFVIEACEYKDNYLNFPLDGAIILNVEEDHPDYFKDLDQVIQSFSTYIQQLPADGVVILNVDDPNTMRSAEKRRCKALTFGIDNDADYRGQDLVCRADGSYQFTMMYQDQQYAVQMSAPGRHNVYNGLAAIAMAHYCGADLADACRHVGAYQGAKRRFELTGMIKENVEVYHDYAHHPTEVKATLETAANRSRGKVIAVFQPHTYSRAKTLFREFVDSLDAADHVIVVDIYSAAREKDPGDIHSRDIVKALKDKGHAYCVYAASMDEAARMAVEQATCCDLIITMGAGDIQLVNHAIHRDHQ